MLEDAEKAFTYASYIIPHKLYPKYRLVYLYTKMGKIEKAIDMAYTVICMRPKVESDIANKIKNDLIFFLEEIELKRKI